MPLHRRLVGRGGASILAGVASRNRQAADAGGQEGEGIVLALGVEVVSGSSGRGSVPGRLEGGLCGAAIEGTGGVRSGSRTEVGVERRIGGRVAGQTGGESIRARGAAKVLSVAAASGAEVAAARSKGAGAGRAAHGALAHAVGRGGIHGRGIARVGNHGSAGATGSATEAAHVLGEVVVAAHLVAALPVAGAEGNDAGSSHTAVAAVAATVVAAHVRGRRHHGWWPVAIAVAHIAGGTSADGRERAAEAGRPSLEVREAARGAGPVAGPRSILAGRERRKYLGGAVEDAARRRGDLDGLFVQSTAIHAEALGGLEQTQ